MHEINLVPDIKIKMLKALKLRNLVFFICIIVAAASIGVAAISGAVAGAQRIAMNAKNDRIEAMSAKLKEYSNLGEFLTIQDQLGNISTINENRNVLSRVFNVLDAMVPRSGDKVEISQLTIDLENSRLSMDAQADAGQDPLIDYRVLESFRKGVGLTTYDYGRYVDDQGNEIPTYCIVETNAEGNIYRDEETGGIYALWAKNAEGCDPAVETEEEDSEDEEGAEEETTEEEQPAEENQGEEVKIWRTPQFNEWVKNEYMDLSGTIDGVPHFESECIQYSGTEVNNQVRWTTSNDCLLTEDGMTVSDSSNGKDANDNLVLRFSATIDVDPEIFSFSNKHMMVIGPEAQDVTDSYKQIEGIFGQAATDCKEGDTECITNTRNRTGA